MNLTLLSLSIKVFEFELRSLKATFSDGREREGGGEDRQRQRETQRDRERQRHTDRQTDRKTDKELELELENFNTQGY